MCYINNGDGGGGEWRWKEGRKERWPGGLLPNKLWISIHIFLYFSCLLVNHTLST